MNKNPNKFVYIVAGSLLISAGLSTFQNSLGNKALAQSENVQVQNAEQLVELGHRRLENSLPRGAIEAYEEAISIYQESQDFTAVATTLERVIEISLNLDDAGKAYQILQRVTLSYLSIEDATTRIAAVYSLERLYRYLDKDLEYADILLRDAEMHAENGDSSFQILSLYSASSILLEVGEYERARYSSKQALALSENLEFSLVFRSSTNDTQLEPNLKSEILIQLATASVRLGELDQALEYANEALLIATEESNIASEQSALATLGFVYLELSNPRQALSHLEDSRSICIQIGNFCPLSSVISLHNNLAWAYQGVGRFEEALRNYEYSIYLIQSNQFGQEILPKTLAGLGGLYLEIREYDIAIQVFEEALEIIGDEDPKFLARTLFDIGESYNKASRYEESVSYFQRSLEIVRTIQDDQFQAEILNSLGIVYRNLGELQQSGQYYRQALDIAKGVGNLRFEGVVANGLAVNLQRLGDLSQALELAERALEISRATNDKYNEAVVLNSLSSLYFLFGQEELAVELQEESLFIRRELENDELVARSLSSLSGMYLSLGNYSKALETANEALALRRSVNDLRGEAYTLASISGAYRLSGQLELSLEVSQEALVLARQISDSGLESLLMIEVGIALRSLGRIPEAIEIFEEALRIVEISGSRTNEMSVISHLAHTYFSARDFEEAESRYYQALEVSESLRSGLQDNVQISFFERSLQLYEQLQLVLVAQEKYGEALEISERGRARALSELIADRSGIVSSEELLDIDEIRSLARDEDITIVQYSLVANSEIGRGAIQLWIISPESNTVRYVNQPLSDIDLTALVTDTRDAIGVRGVDRAIALPTVDPNQSAQDLAQRRAETDENLRQLHQILIDPIADLLPTDPNQKVAFIPQGELFLVPFPALKDANGQYLIENHTILTAPSIQVLQLTQDLSTRAQTPTPLQADNPLIVGDPAMPTVTFLSDAGNFESVRLQPLYGARQEAEAVGENLNASALLGDAATEARVKQQIASADLIHLATHGLLEYGDPRQTGSRDTPGAIALAPGNGEDGLLTSTEILQMELQADLVVLSACDTGRGRITGDGVIGLSRSFIAAGVPSVIVSLWAVPDAPTAELMTEFYDQLAQGQTKAQALRQAMLTTMQTRPDPKDWAAFTLIGNAE
jgi:CHAT domain-containing protein/Flp pilus assembly protein TadD